MANDIEISIIAIDAASNILSNIGENFGFLGQAAVAGVGLAADAMTGIIKQGAEAQDTMVMFNAVIDKSSLVQYKDALLQLADAQSKTTRFSEDQILAADTVLSKYTNLGDKLPEVSKLTLDFATLQGTDATSAATQLGKALEDIGGGSLTLLARTRLLTKEESDAAKEMAKNGDVAGAQTYIIDILTQKTGGLADKMGSDYSGKVKIFQNSMEKLQETLAGPLLDAFTPLLDRFQKMADYYAPLLVTAFNQYVVPAINWMVDSLIQLSNWWWQNGPGIIEKAQPMIDMLKQGFGEISNALSQLLNTALKDYYNWYAENAPMIDNFVQKMGEAFKMAFPIIIGLITATINVIGLLIPVVLNLISGFMNFSLQWQAFWQGFDNAAIQSINNVISAINKVSSVIKNLTGINLGQEGLFAQFVPSVTGTASAITSDRQSTVLPVGNTPVQNNITLNVPYSPTLTTNTAADVQAIMPIIAQGVEQAARTLGIVRRY